MAKDEFFADDQVEEQGEQQEVEKIKLGEKEYSQDELNKLVGLGEKAAELEDKWNTKIDKLYPEYTKKSQKLSELEPKLAEYEQKLQERIEQKQETGVQLTPEEQALQIKQELKKYDVVTKDDIYQFIANFDAVKELNRDIDGILNEAKDTGKPVSTREDFLKYMDENGVKNPKAAYKLMFEDELKDWETKQVNSLKMPGLETERTSNAGGKEPAPVKVTKENLSEMLKQALSE